MEENIVNINDTISINKEDLKDAVMGSLNLSKKEDKYNWDFIIDEAIRNGVDLEEETIIVQSKDWAFCYHIITLDQLWGVGI